MVNLDTTQLSIQSFAPLADLDGGWGELPAIDAEDANFVVIHDEPNFTIVFDGHDYTGQIVICQGMRLSRKQAIAKQYGLVIEDVVVSKKDRDFATIYFRSIADETKEV